MQAPCSSDVNTTSYPSDPALTQYHASIAHLPFKDRLSQSRVDLPRKNESRSTLKLSREEVIAKYSPVADPKWTEEVAAEFFAGLPRATYRESVNPEDDKAMLLREFATGPLKAKRMSANYLSTLGAILGQFADADADGTEYAIARRDDHLGTEKTIRTIQAQMLTAGLLVKETRTQGHGFVGPVFIYSPSPPYRYRKATSAYLEKSYRLHEGEAPACPVPSNISPEDVPY